MAVATIAPISQAAGQPTAAKPAPPAAPTARVRTSRLTCPAKPIVAVLPVQPSLAKATGRNNAARRMPRRAPL